MLKELRRLLVSEKEDKNIFDIVVYGSSLKGKGKPNDLDILVIFFSGMLRERLDRIQEIKSKLKHIEVHIDIKQALIRELFSEEFFARTGIFLEGFSIFTNKPFSNLLGFSPYTLFWYTLDGLTHKDKVKFNYILAGRAGLIGILKEMNGERLANGAVKIPIIHSIEFEEILKNNRVNYRKKDILEAI